MLLRVTDLLVDILDRYEPDEGEDEPSDFVTEESAGIEAFGMWTILADEPLEEIADVVRLVERLELDQDEDFAMAEGLLAFSADGLLRDELLDLVDAVDANATLLEVSGELDVHERSLTWHGEGAALEPMPMPLPRPDDEIHLLVEEFAIQLRRHAAAAPALEDGVTVLAPGIEIYGRPYLLVRDEIEDPVSILAALAAAGVPAPAEARAHRVEWADGIPAADVYAAVHALKPLNPAVGFSGGVTWRNESFEVEEGEDATGRADDPEGANTMGS